MRVAVMDYGTGNLHSLRRALEAEGATVTITPDADSAVRADALVLPGVGSFGSAAARLAPAASRLRSALDAGLPCLGICLGMQLLYESSAEGEGAGLGVMGGSVRRLVAKRIPHMGWNDVEPQRPDPLFAGLDTLLVYYANSYVAEPADDAHVIAYTSYGSDRFPAAIRMGSVVGVQFHPEKSGSAGRRVVRNFLASAAGAS